MDADLQTAMITPGEHRQHSPNPGKLGIVFVGPKTRVVILISLESCGNFVVKTFSITQVIDKDRQHLLLLFDGHQVRGFYVGKGLKLHECVFIEITHES